MRLAPRCDAVATEAREFLRVYAGPDSQWLKQADDLYSNNGERKSRETGIRALGDLLEAWCRQVRRGVVEVVGERTLNEITGTRIDLMGQVRQLLEDKQGHPAAPIMLCGAALEIALRALADAQNVPYPDRPGINKLTTALRTAKLITAQDVRDLDSCAGMRNLDAHGQFDTLSLERAGLMEQATNLLLRRSPRSKPAPSPTSRDPARPTSVRAPTPRAESSTTVRAHMRLTVGGDGRCGTCPCRRSRAFVIPRSCAPAPAPYSTIDAHAAPRH